MKRILWSVINQSPSKMATLPPRKFSNSSRSSKQSTSPIQILLQMGFPRHRALKALAATGNRSVQLASDWLLTHVNDTHLDVNEPREYILYASPTGPLLAQLQEFWEKSKNVAGWNGAHNLPPHITLVSFFKAPDETSLQIAKAVKHVVESAGDPPSCPLKVEPYMSHNFMGLFVSDEHADYLKRIAVQYVKQVSSASVSLEPHVKSLHITLAYHFDVAVYEALKALVGDMEPFQQAGWELRLYSRDPRFATHQVYKVTQGYEPKASDELELVLGDYIYVDEENLSSSTDGWVHGTSWLTGVSGYLPAVYTRRTADSDAWTLHRAMSLNNNGTDSKSESDSNTDGELVSYPHEDAAMLARDKSEETYKEWDLYWNAVRHHRTDGILNVTSGNNLDWTTCANGENKVTEKPCTPEVKEEKRRWVFAMRHGERVDLTYGLWVPHCFDDDKYVRKDLNLPLSLGEREGGKDAYSKDTPLTRVGRFQAALVGEAMRLAGVTVTHVYASAALRCVETAHEFLTGLQADPSVKIRVEPGLFEYKLWHANRGLAPFMTPAELQRAGYNVDTHYKPLIDLDVSTPETLEEFYERNEKVIHKVVEETESEGSNVLFVGHASTLDMVTLALKQIDMPESEKRPYQIYKHLLRVPYCALAALRSKPWRLVSPPCPPSINSSSGRFDWKVLEEV